MLQTRFGTATPNQRMVPTQTVAIGTSRFWGVLDDSILPAMELLGYAMVLQSYYSTTFVRERFAKEGLDTENTK